MTGCERLASARIVRQVQVDRIAPTISTSDCIDGAIRLGCLYPRRRAPYRPSFGNRWRGIASADIDIMDPIIESADHEIM